MPQKRWFFDPDSGGIKIPDSVKPDVEKRITSIAEKHVKGKYTRLDIRFKGQFCYIDAYQEPEVSNDWPPEDWPETKEEYIKRLRNILSIYAGFDILVMIDGALHSIHTAMRNMNYPFTLMESSWENLRMHSSLRQYICSKW